MFYSMAMTISIILNLVCILAGVIVCVVGTDYRWTSLLADISIKSRYIGLLYIFLSWFTGNGVTLASGKTTYENVVHWIEIFSIGHFILFCFITVSVLWNSHQSMNGNKVLVTSLIYFVAGFLLH